MDSKSLQRESSPASCTAPILNVIISGCSGRMGRHLLSHSLADPTLRLLGGICRSAGEQISCTGWPSESGQKKPLRTIDSGPKSLRKASFYVRGPGTVAQAHERTQWDSLVQSRKQAENEAPVCSSLDELLLLTEEGSAPAVVVDFSHPSATMALLQTCVRLHLPMVVGTTGFSAEEKAAINEAAKEIPLCVAANFSLGINLLINLVGEVTSALGEQFDIEVVEAHHNLKADAPSGTALCLVDSIKKARQQTTATKIYATDPAGAPDGRKEEQPSDALHLVELAASNGVTLAYGRRGGDTRRKKGEIGIHSLRLGNVVGEHSVIYASSYERVVLQHQSESRDVFAVGALEMAKWIALKPNGQYSVSDMLCEKKSCNSLSRGSTRTPCEEDGVPCC